MAIKSDLSSIANKAGYIPSADWTNYLRGLTPEGREELRVSLFGESPTQVPILYPEVQDLSNEIYTRMNRMSMGYENQLGTTGLDSDWIPGMNYASPYAPQEEYDLVRKAYQLYMQNNDSSWYDTPFGMAAVGLNPLNALESSGVNSVLAFLDPGTQSMKDIGETINNPNFSSLDKLARVGSSFFDPITNPGISEAGRQSGSAMRDIGAGSIADNAEAIGGIVGSIFGQGAAGYGMGTRISGRYDEAPASGTAGAGLAALGTYAGKLAGGLVDSKALGNLAGTGAKSLAGAALQQLIGATDDSGMGAVRLRSGRAESIGGDTATETLSEPSTMVSSGTTYVNPYANLAAMLINEARLTPRQRRYEQASRGLFPSQYSGLIGR